MAQVERSDEQAARNEAIFREANERIAERRGDLETLEGLTPFLCECEDAACTAVMRIPIAEYERVRADEALFVIVPGHPTRGTETDLRGDGWVCVLK
jgi:hypothetical protein